MTFPIHLDDFMVHGTEMLLQETKDGIFMASLNVDVKPEIINWILYKIQSESIAGSAAEILYKWQTGEKTPIFNQVEDMSEKMNILFGYFFLGKPPVEECAIVEYRTVDSAYILFGCVE